jgi:hypothetical protein
MDEFITNLGSTTDGQGADLIGITPLTGVEGTTVADQIAGLRALIDQIQAGAVPNGSINNTMLANDVKIGSLAALVTTVKTSVTDALNEVAGKFGDMTTLTTTAKNTIVAVLNELDGKCGILANLTTTNKTSLVAAINENRTYTDTQIAALVNSSPAALDTLNELATALGNDPNFATTVLNQIAAKADASALTTHTADNAKQIPHLGTTTNVGNAYSVTTTETIDANEKFTITINTASTGSPTLSVSTIAAGAAKNIVKAGGAAASVKAGTYTFFWDGTNFQLLGEGGEYGTAGAPQVATGYTVGTENGILPGTAILINPVAGENVAVSAASNGTGISALSYTQTGAYFTVRYAGTIRVKFDLRTTNASYTAYGKVYKNGVPTGIERASNNTTTGITFTEDFVVNANDTILIYLKISNSSGAANWFNFKICITGLPSVY